MEAAKINRKSFKNRCKIERKTGCILRAIFYRFLVDFWSIFGAKLGPQTPRKSTKNDHRNMAEVDDPFRGTENRSRTPKESLETVSPAKGRPRLSPRNPPGEEEGGGGNNNPRHLPRPGPQARRISDFFFVKTFEFLGYRKQS